MARAAVMLLLVVTLRGAIGAATIAADTAPHGKPHDHSGVVPSHGKGELHSAHSKHTAEDAEPHGVHSARQGEDAELHSTAGHTHHATAATGHAHQEKHARPVHAEDLPKVAEKGAEGPKSGEDAAEASPEAEPEEDAEELEAEPEQDAEEMEAAEDDAEGFEGPEEGPVPKRSRRHEFAVDAAGDAAELAQGGGVIMRRHNHTKGEDFDEGYLEEEESLVQEDADLAEQARRSGWWSRRRAPPRRRRAPVKVHCAWASWGSWGKCSTTCGPGKQSRTRGYATLQKNGGNPCGGAKSETQTCEVTKCTTTTTTSTSTTTTSTTTTTTKKILKAGALRPAGGGALALLLTLTLAQHLL